MFAMKCFMLLGVLALTTSYAAAEPALPQDPPKGVDRAMIQAAVSAVKPEADACGRKLRATGLVKVTTKIMPSGNLESVEIKVAANKRLGACVVAAFKKMQFPETVDGGGFTYPLVFE